MVVPLRRRLTPLGLPTWWQESTGLTETIEINSTTTIMTKNTKTHPTIPRNLHCSTPSRICPENCRKPTQNFFKLTCQIFADPKTNTTSSNTYYLTISAPSPIKSRKKIKSTSSRAYSETRPSIFGKLSPSTQQRRCKMSSSYSEQNSQRKTWGKSPNTSGMKPDTTRPLRHLETS